MSFIHGKLNQIEKRIASIKQAFDDSVEIATGVWRCDASGEVIPDSGPMTRVPIEKQNSYGVLLLPEPVDKEGFQKVVKKCEAYQKTLRDQAEQDLS